MIKALIIGLITSLLTFSPAQAQDGETFAEWITGDWAGSGQFSGQESMATLTVEDTLGGRFHAFRYRFAAAANDGGTTYFEGLGLYHAHGERAWTGQWFDSMGNVHLLNGAIDGETLVAHWGDRGRTHYRRVGGNRLEIVDAMQNATGEWQEFARYSLNRLTIGGSAD
ncbi:hypothetical protein [Parasphingopyxis sp.]|uniref:hypothetical protein n=1 Tax=Parasphingopyxis sp. TaxID=1920299 RepID=UPI0026044A5F|nr:hypothetical protein [Parasphingopyxis sp.]